MTIKRLFPSHPSFASTCRSAAFSLRLAATALVMGVALGAAVHAQAPVNEWIWMGGSSTLPGANAGQAGVYGTLGTAAAGNIPGGRDVPSTWTDGSGNLWVFGGYSADPNGVPAALNDLWKFNPSTNEWTWISGSNATPYWGTPAGVYGTMGTPAAGNTPGGRESAATWVDKSGNLWLFGGFGAQSYEIQTGYLNDLWEFNPSTGLWAWMGGAGPVTYSIPAVYGTMGTPAATNLPGARQGATTWTDSSGNFWLFGGYGAATDTIGYLNDLWEFNPSTGQWTWMNGSSAFGTHCYSTYNYSLCGVPGVFGTLGTPAAGNMPGGDEYGSGWTDSSGNFWLFGGFGADSRGLEGDVNDLWEFNPSLGTYGEWAWMGGSMLGPWDNGTPAVYGTPGTFAASNLPGGRQGAASWTDSSGNFWLFGGNGLDVSGGVTATGGTGDLNDLWEYSPSKGYWAWMGGSNTVGVTGGGQPGVYGTLGTAAAENIPGGRDYFASLTDKSGNFWLFGGAGFDSADTSGFLNDVWEFQNPTGATTTLLPAATPTFSLAGGTYAGAQTVTISDDTAGAIIYYTIGVSGGTTPTINSTMYDGTAITIPYIGLSQTVEAFVTAPGYAPSAVATVVYTITAPVEATVATPTFSPLAGIYSSAQTVTISDATPGATIYYTTDGTTPTTTPELSGTATIAVYSNSTPITISSTGTVQAIAALVNEYNSAVASATFTITPPVASPIGNWAWMGGSSTIPSTESGQPGVYGTLGTPAAANIPGGRDEGATWTDKNGNLWLFGGFGYDSVGTALGILNDLWEFNPSTNQWTWMGGSKTVPTCSFECGQGGVYGTPGTPAVGNIPGARDGAATWTDSSGHLWLFGGFGFDTNDAIGYLNDLWEFNPSTTQWTWMSGSSTVGSNCIGTAPHQICDQPGVYGTLKTAAAGNVPGGHVGAASWIDSSGNLWLFGGYGSDSAGNVSYLNDVWEFNTSTKQWTWMGGSSVGVGGGQPGVYGTPGTPAAGNIPGSRASASTWTDSNGHFWLFGGTIPAVTPQYDYFNDLWEFNPSTNQWAWMGGSSSIPLATTPGSNCALQYTAEYPNCGQPGVYGTPGSPAAGNIPGGRSSAANWIDSGGNLWLFGGVGMDSAGSTGMLDDLWSFSPSTNQWTWMGGSNLIGSDCLLGPNDTCGQPGVYGTLESPAVENIPGSRVSASSWTDSSGHFWLFGGIGVDANGSHEGFLNDVWEYQPSVIAPPTDQAPNITSANGTTFTPGTADSFTVTATGYPSPTITESGALPTGVTFTGGSISGTPTQTGTFLITFYANNGVGSQATQGFTLTVVSPPTIGKAFGASSILLNGATSLTFTITNPNATASLTGVGFSDSFPAGLQVASSPNATNTCGGTFTPTASSISVSLSGATVTAAGSCTLSVSVTGTSTGTKNNTTGAVSSTEGGTGTVSNTATVTVAAVSPPTIGKAFGASSILLNGATSLTFTITNPNATASLTGVGFSDSFPAGLQVASSPNATNTCGGTFTPTASSISVSLSGATVAAAGSCTLSVSVTGATTGIKNNTTGAVSSTEGGTGTVSNTATVTVAAVSPPTIGKAFGASSILLNGATSLTFTITNPNATASLTGVGFSDSFPAGLQVASSPNATNTCGGTFTPTASSISVSLSGATVAAAGSCTLSVSVTGATTGIKNNTTGAVSSTNGGTGTVSNTATVTVAAVSPPTIGKAFGASSILLNGATSLTFTITNPNATASLTGVGFSDSFPAGLQVASSPNATNTCGGTFTPTASSISVSLSGATVAAAGSCTLSVSVTGATTGIKNNTTGAVSSTNGGTGTVSNTATVTVAAVSPPTIGKAFGASSILLNGATSLTFTITNPNATASLTGVGFSDSFPAGLQVASSPNATNTCGGTFTPTASSASVSLSGATVAAAGSCTLSVSVTGATTGIKNNTTGAVSSTEGGTGTVSNTATVTVAAVSPPTIGKAFGASSILLNGATSLTFTITNPNATASLTGVGFSDSFPAGLQVASSPNATNTCGGTFTPTASSISVSLSGATVAAGGSCTLSVSVTGATTGIKNNTTGAVSSTNGGTGTVSNTATLIVGQPPSITSANNVTFTLGASNSFTVKATGSPIPSISESGALPAGVTFTNNGNGTATLGGIPTTGGTFNLTITASNGVSPNAAQSFTLTANGPQASISTTGINFGTLYLGSIVTKTVTVTNIGDAAMTIAAPFISIVQGGNSSEFVAVSLCPNSLAAGKSCTISITFVAGPFFNPQTAMLSIMDNAPGSPQKVSLTALVIDPQTQLSVTSWNFGTQKENTSSAAKPVTLTNTGLTALTIDNIAIAGKNPTDFTETNNCPSSLGVKSSCTIGVTFKPLAKGSLSGSVVITDNAQNSPQSISLSGTGN